MPDYLPAGYRSVNRFGTIDAGWNEPAGQSLSPQAAMGERMRRMGWIVALGLMLMGAPWAAGSTAAQAACPANRHCHGCGCAGGPGYRAPDGHCVSYRELSRVCGSPPSQRCRFENAPGTGAHAACAMGRRRG